MPPETSIGGAAREFPSTRWTVILSARKGPEAARAALEHLLATYWKPLYYFARRKGLAIETAKDAVQGLFATLLERDFLARLDPARGRFRGYIRTALENHLHNLHESASAAKRGGAVRTVSLDWEAAERDLACAHEDPARAFDAEWASAVMERALAALEREFEDGTRAGPFDVVRAFFRLGDVPSYSEAAAACDVSVPRFKALLHRARARFRELVRAEIAETAATPGDVDAELADLVHTLG